MGAALRRILVNGEVFFEQGDPLFNPQELERLREQGKKITFESFPFPKAREGGPDVPLEGFVAGRVRLGDVPFTIQDIQKRQRQARQRRKQTLKQRRIERKTGTREFKSFQERLRARQARKKELAKGRRRRRR